MSRLIEALIDVTPSGSPFSDSKQYLRFASGLEKIKKHLPNSGLMMIYNGIKWKTTLNKQKIKMMMIFPTVFPDWRQVYGTPPHLFQKLPLDFPKNPYFKKVCQRWNHVYHTWLVWDLHLVWFSKHRNGFTFYDPFDSFSELAYLTLKGSILTPNFGPWRFFTAQVYTEKTCNRTQLIYFHGKNGHTRMCQDLEKG